MTSKSPALSLRSLSLRIAAAVVASGLLLTAGQLGAADPISGPELRNIVEGQLVDGGAYRVFYDPSGVARADAGLGSWRIDGDRLCAEFEDNDHICLARKPASSEVLWLSPHGDYEGNGRILSGNPFKL